MTPAAPPAIVDAMSTTSSAFSPAGLLLLGAVAVVAFLALATCAYTAAFVAAAACAALFDGARI